MRDVIYTKIWSTYLKKTNRLNYAGANQKIILKWIITDEDKVVPMRVIKAYRGMRA